MFWKTLRALAQGLFVLSIQVLLDKIYKRKISNFNNKLQKENL